MLWFSFTLVQAPHGGILYAFQQIKVNKGTVFIRISTHPKG